MKLPPAMVRGFGRRFHPTSVNDARRFSCQPDCLHPSSGQHPDSVRSDSSSQGILSKDRGSSRDIKPPNHLCRRYPHAAAGHFISTSVEQQGSRTMAPTTSRPLASLVPVKLKEEKNLTCAQNQTFSPKRGSPFANQIAQPALTEKLLSCRRGA